MTKSNLSEGIVKQKIELKKCYELRSAVIAEEEKGVEVDENRHFKMHVL